MGRLLLGYCIMLCDFDGYEVEEGEICIELNVCLIGLMEGYVGNFDKIVEVMCGGVYYMFDIVVCDDSGYLIYVGCVDDVFKVLDYCVSLFELESVLIEYLVIVEVVVVLSFDFFCLVVLKVFLVLCVGYEVGLELVCDIFGFCCS